jgi:hypothetical protein
LLKLGFLDTMDIRDTLAKRIQEESDLDECVKGLRALEERGTIPWPVFKEWKDRIQERFGAEETKEKLKEIAQREEEEPRLDPVTLNPKREALMIIRAIESGDPQWRDKVEAWLAEVKEAYRIGFQNLYDEWIRWREKLRKTEPCEKGTIEILCNNPFKEELKVIELKCTSPYHPEMLFEEVRTWLKGSCGREVDEGELRYWHIWDEEGLVDPKAGRDPRYGERYVIVLQARESEEDVEQKCRPDDPGAGIQRFIERTRWRRLKSQYKLEIEVPRIKKPPEEALAPEEAVEWRDSTRS